MRDGALHQSVGARMPRAPGIGGQWSRDEIARDVRNDDVVVAAPDIGVAGFERCGPRDLANADRAEAVQTAGERPREICRHMLGDNYGPRESRWQCDEQRF